jgi:hypothetical protein
MKVQQMTSSKGNSIANQFTIVTDKGVFFQSYSSLIAFIPYDKNEKTQLDADTWDYSRTTSKYRCMFLNETTGETRNKTKEGKYILTNLN